MRSVASLNSLQPTFSSVSVRSSTNWGGPWVTRLLVEQTSTGVLIKPAPALAPTRAEGVFGCLAHEGPPRSVEEMNQAVLDEARRRHARD